jgi:phage tail sheath gpL-like
MSFFNAVPTNIRVPFVAVEIDNSRAQQGAALLPYRAVIIGQKTSAGTATANALYRVTNVEQVIILGGRGSMLHRMAIGWFASNKFTEVYIGVLADNGAGAAAAGSVAFSGTVTAAGTLNLYLGGELVQVAVASAEASATTATNVAAAINANLDLPVTAAVDGEVTTKVNITYRHKGVVGNSYNVRVNYQDGEALPAGLVPTIVQPTGGTSNPVLTSLIAAMGDIWYQIIAHPYTDATSLSAIEVELARRFGPMTMIDGVAITASAETHANLGTLGDARNSPHSSIVATNQSPMPVDVYAAETAAIVAYFGNIDPARPFQTLPYSYCKPPAEADEFTLEERNLLLYDGISTTKVDAGGVVRIERMITTYKTSPSGASDVSYLDLTTMLTLLYLRFTFRNRILSRYPRHKLADDGNRFGSGQAVITPKIGKAEACAWFRDMEELGLVENFPQFKADLLCQRSTTDRNRLEWLLPPDLVNQFIVGAAQVQFRL